MHLSSYLENSCEALKAFSCDKDALGVLANMAAQVSSVLKQGGKLLVAGNGGSAGDANISQGNVSRLMYDREPHCADNRQLEHDGDWQRLWLRTIVLSTTPSPSATGGRLPRYFDFG